MTDTERSIANFIRKNYDEDEHFYPHTEYRLYVSGDFCGAISSQGEETDVLFFLYTKNEENGDEYIQLFISSPDDVSQDFIYLDDLTEEEKEKVIHLFFEEVKSCFGTDIAVK